MGVDFVVYLCVLLCCGLLVDCIAIAVRLFVDVMIAFVLFNSVAIWFFACKELFEVALFTMMLGIGCVLVYCCLLFMLFVLLGVY